MSTPYIPTERIEGRIFLLRGKKVIFDKDLALLYGVETKVLKQAVRRNLARFPDDFMFKLSSVEQKDLRSQFVTSNVGRGGDRYVPLAFTEQGVAMLSSVLKSERAVMVNVQIIRTFSKLREMVANSELLRLKLEAMEKRYDGQFSVVFDALRKLLVTEADEPPTIGFKTEGKFGGHKL
jgi:hypothetical protein